MSFPYMNADTMAANVVGKADTTIIAWDETNIGQMNVASVPGVVDVSAMEFSIGAHYDAGSTKTYGIVTGAATWEVNFVDGGPTGDATAAAALFAIVTNTTTAIFGPSVPHDVAGTSTTDLDADDWVNFNVQTVITGVTSAGSANVAVAYIYGKPAGIN